MEVLRFPYLLGVLGCRRRCRWWRFPPSLRLKGLQRQEQLVQKARVSALLQHPVGKVLVGDEVGRRLQIHGDDVKVLEEATMVVTTLPVATVVSILGTRGRLSKNFVKLFLCFVFLFCCWLWLRFMASLRRSVLM